ncbi:hypothetical protein BJV82DRAFT_615637 [Fennellomyces sp. T-0311]|nr:hypothetical protein BJV82DRAFT_615637 [Fennellomyces sp. T-0311]
MGLLGIYQTQCGKSGSKRRRSAPCLFVPCNRFCIKQNKKLIISAFFSSVTTFAMSIPPFTVSLLSMFIQAPVLPQCLILFAFGVVAFAVVCLVHFLFNSCLGQDWVLPYAPAASGKEGVYSIDNMFLEQGVSLSFAPSGSLTVTEPSPFCDPPRSRRQKTLVVLNKLRNKKPPPFQRQNAFLLEKGESLPLNTVSPSKAVVGNCGHDKQGDFLRPMRMADYKQAVAAKAAAEWRKRKAEWNRKQAIWEKTTKDNMKYPRRK